MNVIPRIVMNQIQENGAKFVVYDLIDSQSPPN